MPQRPTPALTARHLPEIRAELVQWLREPGETGGPAVWSWGFDPATAAQERRAAGDWASALEAAELFYVSAGMALPSYRLHPEDLPATHGMLLWEEPATDPYDAAQVRAARIARPGRGARTDLHNDAA